MEEEVSPKSKSSMRVAGLVVSARSDSPSSNSSPGREQLVPESAQQMGKTLHEIAKLLTDSPRLGFSRSSPLPSRNDDVEEDAVTRFQTDPPTDRFGFPAHAEDGEPEETQEDHEIQEAGEVLEEISLGSQIHEDPSIVSRPS